MFAFAAPAAADITSVARCQKKIATAGADFAKRVIVTTLKCTEEVAECQVQCEEGVFGPSCENNPPPCCDPDDRASNATFDACMAEADDYCADQEAKIASYEETKQNKIIAACTDAHPGGALRRHRQRPELRAGERRLPRAQSRLHLQSDESHQLSGRAAATPADRPDQRAPEPAGERRRARRRICSRPSPISVTYKLREDLPAAGKVDLWSITGQAGDKVIVRVKTRNDLGGGQSTIEPTVVLLGGDQTTPVADTLVNNVPCCGAEHLRQSVSADPARAAVHRHVLPAVRASGANGAPAESTG